MQSVPFEHLRDGDRFITSSGQKAVVYDIRPNIWGFPGHWNCVWFNEKTKIPEVGFIRPDQHVNKVNFDWE